MRDAVDDIIEQWNRERPDLDVGSIAVIGRLSRVSERLDRAMAANFARHGLQPGWFDVLASLRRSGEPYELTPTAMQATMMLTTSGAITKRIDKLVQEGLVERRADPDDGRGVRVRLTDAGLERVDAALVDHMATQQRLLGGLSLRQREELARLLRRWGLALSGG